MKYCCELCGFVYDEELGDPQRGIPAGTSFADLDEHFACSRCGSEKEAFSKLVRRTKAFGGKSQDEAAWDAMKYSDEPYVSER